MLILVGKGGFAGEAPRIDATKIADNAATLALNADLRQGDLRPYPDVGAVIAALTAAGAIKTVYRFGKNLTSDTQYWWPWVEEVNVVRGMVAGDAVERTYWTGTDRPRCSDYVAAVAPSPPYPAASYAIGVPIPDSSPTVAVTGTPTAGTTPINRFYREVFVSQWSTGLREPSAPGPASAMITASPGQTITVTLESTIPTGPVIITHRQIYRTDSGLTGGFRFVTEVPISTTTWVDNKTDDELGEVLESDAWLPPPSDLQNLVALPNGIMAGTNGFDVMLTEPYRPYAWSTRVPIGEAPVGLGVTGGSLIALTKGKPYLMAGSDPASFIPQDLAVAQACLSRRGIVDMRYALCYPGADGLIMVTAEGVASIVTEGIFTGEQWRALGVSALHAYRDGTRYVAFFDAGGGFELDPRDPQRTFVRHDINARAAYVEPSNNQVYVVDTSNQVRRWRIGASRAYQWRSKVFETPHKTCFRFCQVSVSGTVTVRIIADGVTRLERDVTSQDVFALPGGFKARRWQIELAGTGVVQWAAIAHSPEELANV